MQLAAKGADLLGQPALNRHVNIFVRRQKRERPLFQFTLDVLQTLNDLLPFDTSQDFLFHQHAAVGQPTACQMRART
jgi:hypothetical protein